MASEVQDRSAVKTSASTRKKPRLHLLDAESRLGRHQLQWIAGLSRDFGSMEEPSGAQAKVLHTGL